MQAHTSHQIEQSQKNSENINVSAMTIKQEHNKDTQEHTTRHFQIFVTESSLVFLINF
jgi:hypothetical protein